MADLLPESGTQQIGPGDGSGGEMDPLELQAIVRAEIEDARTFIDSEISPLRALASNYYNARPFGDEQDGRSKVISQDVRDTVMGILPSLCEIFFGSENAVEFNARRPGGEEYAEQATDWVNFLVTIENKGFIEFYKWFKDALIRKIGIVKGFAEEIEDVCAETYSGLDEESVHMVLSQEGITRQKITPDASYSDFNQPGAALYSVNITRKYPCKKIRFECIPPEEFLISRRARSVEDATFTCHRTEKHASDLIAMGISPEDVAEASSGSSLDMNLERISRQPWITTFGQDLNNPSMRLISYHEAYIRVDYDGDGIAELRRVCLLGDGYRVISNDPIDGHPFVDLCPDPEPHVVFGNSVADLVMDIQRIKSQVWRMMLDSLAQSITPRTAIVEGQVNLDDVLNNEVGGIVRMRAPGMVQPLETPFVGQQALPILQTLDDMRESRTGLTKASQGLNADALQSTTQAAVAATVEAAQQRIKIIARIFAETGVKRLFKLLLRLTVTHQDKAKVVRLRNKWVNVDPREWDADMDVTPNVALGSGTKEDRMNALVGIKTAQETILQTLGPSNPIVSLGQYSNTLRKITELAGFKNSSQFFADLPANYQPPQQQGPPPPTPQEHIAMMLAQAEMQKNQTDAALKQKQLQLDQEKMLRDEAVRRYQIDTSASTALAATAAQYHSAIATNMTKIASTHAQQERNIQGDSDLAAQQAAHDAMLQAQQAEAQQQLAEQQAQNQPPQGGRQ